MGRSDISSSDQRNALYNTGGKPARFASGIIETDGAGGAIVRNPHNITGATIEGTNIRVAFGRPARSVNDYQSVAIERPPPGPLHALPDQYAYIPTLTTCLIVSQVDFSVNTRTLVVRFERM